MSENKAVANIGNNCIESSEDMHEFFVILIDSKLTFETHINKLCRKASQKLNFLARISIYMTFDEKR